MKTERQKNLWEKIEAFQLDNKKDAYPFSLRLKIENNWTDHFTKSAIEEYKKFIFLAAISDKLVVPSETIDTVWHLHLIYNRSYDELCALTEQRIFHQPSGKNPGEAKKFKKQFQYTIQLYRECFGTPSNKIWGDEDPLEDSVIYPAKISLVKIIGISLSILLVLILSTSSIFKIIYPKIDSEYFISGMVSLGIAIIFGSYYFNRNYLKNTFYELEENSLYRHLSREEIMFFHNKNNAFLIHVTTNELIEKGILAIKDKEIFYIQKENEHTIYEWAVINALGDSPIIYSEMLKNAIEDNAFIGIRNICKHILSNFRKSHTYLRLMIYNIGFSAIWYWLIIERFYTAYIFQKPNDILIVITIFYTIITLSLLTRLDQSWGNVISEEYQTIISTTENAELKMEWKYLLAGNALFSISLFEATKDLKLNKKNGCGSGCSSGGGDGCGSGCGSSCGGCGGGD